MVVMEAWLKLLWRLIDWWSIRSLPYKYLPRELELRGFSTQEPAWIQLSTKPIKIWINVKTLISIHTLISLVYKSIKPKLCLLRHEIVYKSIKSKLCLLRHEKYFDYLNLKFLNRNKIMMLIYYKLLTRYNWFSYDLIFCLFIIIHYQLIASKKKSLYKKK